MNTTCPLNANPSRTARGTNQPGDGRFPRTDRLGPATPHIVLAAIVIAMLPPLLHSEPAAADTVEVLNIDSQWRYHFAKRSAGVIYRGAKGEKLVASEGNREVGSGYELEVQDDGTMVHRGGWTEIPPITGPWMEPDFDDSGWMIHQGAFLPGDPYPVGHGQRERNRKSRLFVRGGFVAEDVEALRDLRLSVQYRGGIVVYLNGHEVARGHVGGGPVDAGTMAADYDSRAVEFNPREGEEKAAEAAQHRLRSLEEVALPVEHFEQGVNTLAFKVLASAMPHEARGDRHKGAWATVGLQSVSLQAAPAGAILSSKGKPEDVHVWSTLPITDLDVISHGNPADLVGGVPPIRMTAARNTIVSGQAVVSAPEPVQGVRATLGHFTGEQGRLSLPDDAVRIRYPARTIDGMDYEMRRPDVLVDEPIGDQAVQPVWVTVAVPSDAPAGTYEATLTVEAEGLDGAVDVPVELVVHDWLCPDPLEWRSMVSLVQSPHSVAWHYDVEMWSERHLDLLAPSLSMMRKLGNNHVFVDVILPSFFAPEHGVIVFREEGDRLVPDFTFFDRFMDAYAEHVGEPQRLTLVVWEPHLNRDPALTVTVKKPDGSLENREVPMYGEPGSQQMWEPVLEGVRKRIEQRGWDERAIHVGVAGDVRPSGQTVEFFEQIAPFARWLVYTHGRGEPHTPDEDGKVLLDTGWPGTIHENAMSAGLREYPYNAGWNRGNRAGGVRNGLQRGWVSDWYEPILIYAGRGILHDNSDPASFRLFAGSQVFNRSQGFTRQGIDKWPVVNPHDENAQPRRMVLGAGGWGNLYRQKVRAMAAPGAEGAVVTVRFEMMRQGLQDTEARIYLEQIVVDQEKRDIMGDDFEQQVKELVRAEVNYRGVNNPYPPYAWNPGTDWPERLDRMYELAAKAQRKLQAEGLE